MDAAQYWRTYLEGAVVGRVAPFRSVRRDKRGSMVRSETRIPIAGRSADIFACALAVLVARYAMIEDIVVGIESSGTRIRPLRMAVTARVTSRELLARAARDAVDAAEHAPAAIDDASFTVGVLRTDPSAAALDFALVLDEDDAASLFYDDARFDSAFASRFADQLARLVRGMTSEPERAVRTLPLIDDVERARIIEATGGRVVEHPFVTVDALFRAQVAKTPDAIAVSRHDEIITYRSLADRAHRLARWLRRRVGDGRAVIALALEAHLLPLVEHATWTAGHAFTPLDPKLPARRAAGILTDSRAAIVIASESARDCLANAPCDVVMLDALEAELANEPTDPPNTVHHPHDLAYIIFTSGSTGAPKGVAIHHGALSNLLHNDFEAVAFAEDERVAQFGTCTFDADVEVFWGPLTSGAAVFFVEDDVLLSPPRFMRWLADNRITRTGMASSMFEALRGADWSATKVKRIGTGLEKLNGVHENLPFELAHGYGPTETTITLSRGFVKEFPPPIGKLVHNARIYVLDESLELLPQGAIGEGYIGGTCVGLGYLRADLTAERFLPDPYGPPGSRMYRTGDVFRVRPDGLLQFEGRVDDQVKIRGYRVELGDIENALLTHDTVHECHVYIRDRADGTKLLVAYVVAKPGAPKDGEALRRHAAERLPDYMVPRAYVFLDAFPIAPSGKIDRKALPLPSRGQSGAQEKFALPSSPTEREVVRIFEQILSVAGVERTDDFFALGGHSLLMMRVIAEVDRAFGRQIGVRDILEAPTVEKLARRIEAKTREERPAIRPSADAALASSFDQEYLLGWEARRTPSTIWNHCERVDIEGALDAAALGDALQRVLERQTSLRYTFDRRSSWTPRLLAGADIPLEIIDLRGGAADDVAKLAEARASKPFTFEGEPLFRSALARRDDRTSTLLLDWHQVVHDHDGLPVARLVNELVEEYTALVEGRASNNPATPITYADYAKWSREWFAGADGHAELEAVRRRLAGAKPFAIEDRPSDVPFGPAAHLEVFALGAEGVDRLDRACRAMSSTRFMMTMAALGVVLRRWTGQDDMTVMMLRNFQLQRPELNDVMGRFTSPVPVRAFTGGTPTWTELLSRVRASSLEALAEMGPTPIARVYETDSVPDHPLGRVLVNDMHRVTSRPSPRARAKLVVKHSGVAMRLGARTSLIIGITTASDDENDLRFVINAAADRFERNTVVRLARDLESVMRGIDPNARAE